MLMRTDPFREADRLAQQLFGTAARPTAMLMNAYRRGDTFYVELDLPGVKRDSIELTVEQNVLTVRAQREAVDAIGDIELIANECPAGTFTRQVFSARRSTRTRSKPTTPPACSRSASPFGKRRSPAESRSRAATNRGRSAPDMLGCRLDTRAHELLD